MNKLKRMIKNVNQQNKLCTTPSSQQTYIKLFYRNQMHYNYKYDEKIMKTLIHKNILPADPNKKIKLIIYYNKFKTSNLVIRNNSSPLIGVLQKTSVIYKFKSYITFVIDSLLMMAQSRAESTRDTYNYGQYLNQFPPNRIKVIWEFERIQKKICRHKMSIMFNIYIYI